MVERILKAAQEGVLARLVDKMNWKFEFHERDVAAMDEYLDIMNVF